MIKGLYFAQVKILKIWAKRQLGHYRGTAFFRQVRLAGRYECDLYNMHLMDGSRCQRRNLGEILQRHVFAMFRGLHYSIGSD